MFPELGALGYGSFGRLLDNSWRLGMGLGGLGFRFRKPSSLKPLTLIGTLTYGMMQ